MVLAGDSVDGTRRLVAQNSQIWHDILLVDLVRCRDERTSAWAVPSHSG